MARGYGSVWDGVAQGYDLGNALRTDYARQQAGQSMAAGDYTGGANALLGAGDLNAGLRVQQMQQEQAAAQAKAAKAREEGALKFTSDAAGRLAEIYRATKDKGKTLATFDANFAPRFAELGEDPAEIAELRAQIEADPEVAFMALGVGAAKQAGYEIRNAGEEVLVIDKGTGGIVQRYRGARTIPVGEGVALYDMPGTGGSAMPPADDAPPAPPAAAPRPTGEHVKAVVERLTSAGARITSGRRSPEDNRRVGGAPNSHHLTGHAFDIVPPPGMSMGQLEQTLRSTGVRFKELINEGDHIHIAWGDDEPAQPYEVAQAGGATPGPPGGPRLLVQRPKAPKPTGRMATTEDKQRLGLEGNFWIEADGKPVAVGEKPNKPLTEYQGKAVEYLNAALSGNERINELANAGIYKPTTATDSLFNREKDGTVRFVGRSEKDRQFIQAAKEWLAPILRKDTGAAVTDGEVQQYMDIYIPRFEDSPKVMWQKAQARDAKMRALYGANRTAYDQTFGAPPKWQVLTDPRAKPQGAAPGGPPAPPKVGEVRRGYRFKGGNPAQPASWVKVQ